MALRGARGHWAIPFYGQAEDDAKTESAKSLIPFCLICILIVLSLGQIRCYQNGINGSLVDPSYEALKLIFCPYSSSMRPSCAGEVSLTRR